MSGTTPTTDPTAEPTPRRGLSPALIAFIVFDVLLVVAVVVLGFSMASGGDDEPTAAPTSASSGASSAPAATDDAQAPASPDAPAEGTKRVASPTGNITCDLSPEGASCTIAALAAEPAADPACEGTVGYVVVLDPSGVSTPCEENRPAKAAADVPVLEYGSAETVNNFECASSESGMTCTDTNTGKGFTLARAGVTTF